MYYLYDQQHNLIFAGSEPDLKLYIKGESKKRGRSVYCHNNNQTYSTIKACADALSLDASQLGKHLRREPSYKEVKGLVFSYANECEVNHA